MRNSIWFDIKPSKRKGIVDCVISTSNTSLWSSNLLILCCGLSFCFFVLYDIPLSNINPIVLTIFLKLCLKRMGRQIYLSIFHIFNSIFKNIPKKSVSVKSEVTRRCYLDTIQRYPAPVPPNMQLYSRIKILFHHTSYCSNNTYYQS